MLNFFSDKSIIINYKKNIEIKSLKNLNLWRSKKKHKRYFKIMCLYGENCPSFNNENSNYNEITINTFVYVFYFVLITKVYFTQIDLSNYKQFLKQFYCEFYSFIFCHAFLGGLHIIYVCILSYISYMKFTYVLYTQKFCQSVGTHMFYIVKNWKEEKPLFGFDNKTYMQLIFVV